MNEHRVIISLIGEFDIDVFSSVSEAVQRTFGFSSRMEMLLSDISFAFDIDRNQYNSTEILKRLADRIPSDGVRIIALTHVDLFIPILTYVYGEAQLGGTACIVSTFRLAENLSPVEIESTFLNRIAKETTHELGHTFKLRHCKDPTCLMHYGRCIQDVDNKTDQLCRYCRILLSDELKRLGIK